MESDRYISELIAQVGPAMIEHMNNDHADNVRDYARVFGRAIWAQAATMLTLDRHGFDLEARGDDRLERLRITFETPLNSAEDAHQVLVQMAQSAARAATD
jgi:heme iron utilization protein